MSENNRRFSQYGYPILLGAYTLAALVLFVWTLRFIALHVNAALDVAASQNGILQLDTASADYAGKHLGVSEIPLVDNTAVQDAAQSATAPGAAEDAAPVTAPARASVIVRVLNSTTTSGLALQLQEQLRAAGFTQISAGNSATRLTTTEIRMKAGAEPLRSAVEALIRDEYVLSAPVALPDTATEDILIVIGSQTR